MNGTNALARDDDDAAHEWAVAKLHDEARHIRVALDELQEMGNPDGSASLNLWLLQFDGLQFAMQGITDLEQRAKFEAVLVERRRVMRAILARARKRGSAEAQGLSAMMRAWEKRNG